MVYVTFFLPSQAFKNATEPFFLKRCLEAEFVKIRIFICHTVFLPPSPAPIPLRELGLGEKEVLFYVVSEHKQNLR